MFTSMETEADGPSLSVLLEDMLPFGLSSLSRADELRFRVSRMLQSPSRGATEVLAKPGCGVTVPWIVDIVFVSSDGSGYASIVNQTV